MQDFVTASNGRCHFDPNWVFEIRDQDSTDDHSEDNVGDDPDFTNFVGTFQLTDDAQHRIREQMQPGYVPFSGLIANDPVSAEFYCNGDVQNYDNIEWVGGEDTYCAGFNALVAPEITIKAWKVVCDTEADLPNMQGGADITENTAANWVTTHDACHFVDGWQFEYSLTDVDNPGSNSNDTGLIDFGTTTSGSTATTQTPAMATIDIANNPKIWAREKLPAGYVQFSDDTSSPYPDPTAEFYCSSDVQHSDNWERIEDDQDPTFSLTPGNTYHCVGFNALATRDVDVCKVVEGNGDGVIDGGEFQFTASWPDHSENFTLEAYEPDPDTDGALGEEVCKTFSIPMDATLHVFEWGGDWLPGGGYGSLAGSWNGNADGYPHSSLSDQQPKGDADLDPNTSSVTFTNKTDPRTGTIWNVKVVLNDDADTTPFMADVTGEADYPDRSFAQGDPDMIPNAPVGYYDSVEQDPGDEYAWQGTIGFSGDQLDWDDSGPICPLKKLIVVDEQPLVSIDNSVVGNELLAGGDLVFCHYNLRLAKVVLTKFENIPGANTWNFTSDMDSTEVPPADLVYDLAAATTSETRSWWVTPGDYTIGETEASTPTCGTRTGPVFSDAYETLALTSNSVLSAAQVQASGTSVSSVDISPAPGETVYVGFVNRTCGSVLSASNIIVRKFQDVNGDYDANDAGEGPLSGWHITLDGTSGPALGKHYELDTDGSGVAAFVGVEDGTWTVSETAKVTHTVVGSVYTVGVGPADPTSTDNAQAGATRTGLVRWPGPDPEGRLLQPAEGQDHGRQDRDR